jgi:hypothetical protein
MFHIRKESHLEFFVKAKQIESKNSSLTVAMQTTNSGPEQSVNLLLFRAAFSFILQFNYDGK